MNNIEIVYLPVSSLKSAEYNPRKISAEALGHLKESITRFGTVDPIIVNIAPERKNIVIGGHQRLRAVKELGMETIPTVCVNIPDIKIEQELNLRLNANTGEWDFEKLKSFDFEFLSDIGFSDLDLSNIWKDTLDQELTESHTRGCLEQMLRALYLWSSWQSIPGFKYYNL